MASTVYLSAISLIVQYLNNLGIMAAGGQVYTYVGGSTMPLTTYTDSTGLVANPNPMTLSSTGRPVAASGAPVAFWAPAGSAVRLMVTDSAGNQLVFLDNVPSIGDLTASNNSLQVLLASASSSNSAGTGPVAGADLVANAVKSYATNASVRAANVPVPVTGQTLNISVQGASAAGDGLGGMFYWNPSSTATDDNRTVITPQGATGAGRWLRLYELGEPQIFLSTVDQVVVSNTTPVPDTALTAVLGTPGTYLLQLRAIMLGVGGTGQGYQAQLSYSGGASALVCGGGVVSSNGSAAAVVTNINSSLTESAISSTTGDIVNLDLVLTATTAGTVAYKFCQNSSSTNSTTRKAGSALVITRLS